MATIESNLSFKPTLERPGSAAHVRGVYLWAGEATIALQRAKFPDRRVDAAAHLHAHTPEAARVLAEEDVNLAFLSMNWGFPPEQERAHWRAFAEARRVYNDCGIAVIGYVQASNCLAAGSYATNGWYAHDPAGRRIPYFQNRLMTCWSAETWALEVQRHALRVTAGGAQGVYFDNIWMGATPWTLGNQAGGFAGCCCPHCSEEFGQPVPARLHENPDAPTYMNWRCELVRARVQEWAAVVRERDPESVVLLNNCDIILRDTRTLFGLDPQLLAPLQDALLIENIAVPRSDGATLVTNALTLKSVRALIPDRQPLTVTYEHGIGLDGPPEPRIVSRTMAEAAALGAATVLKGSEYLDQAGRFTVLTAPALANARAAAGTMFRWLAQHAALYERVQPDPDVLILFDDVAFRDHWGEAVPGLAATALAVQAALFSYTFVTPAQLQSLPRPRLVLLPPGVEPRGLAEHESVSLSWLDVPARSASFTHSAAFRRAAHPVMSAIARGYFGNAGVRRTIDALGITRRFLRSPLFRLPRNGGQVARLLRARMNGITSEHPALLERWRAPDGRALVHLVNYADQTNRVHVPLSTTNVRLHTPDRTRFSFAPGGITVELDVYGVIETAI